jgi:hypothetical protein
VALETYLAVRARGLTVETRSCAVMANDGRDPDVLRAGRPVLTEGELQIDSMTPTPSTYSRLQIALIG